MMKGKGPKPDSASARERGQVAVLFGIILLGLLCVVLIGRRAEQRRTVEAPPVEEERLYVSAPVARRMSLGFNGLVADWYWMRSLQYIGHKIINYQGDIKLDDLGPLNVRMLAPLLDTTTTLDPQFMAAYEYGAVVLPSIDVDEAVKLLDKGITANPGAWRLYHHLGYIYWHRGEYRRASEAYAQGARLPGAPGWMEAMSARMLAEGGSLSTAREIYRRMYEQSDDQQVREMAALRLLQVASFEERDVIRRVLSEYERRNGRCAASWSDVTAALRAARLRVNASGAPLDPADTPYLLVKGGCDVDLDWHSKVPYK